MISHLLDPKTLALLKTLADAEKSKPESTKPASGTPVAAPQAPAPMLPQSAGGKNPITPDEVGGLLAFAHANNPLPWVPQQSTEAPVDGPNLAKGPTQQLVPGFMGQFMNNTPAPSPQTGMLGMRGMIGAGPAAAMQGITGTPEAMDALGMAKLNQKPKPGINAEAGWLMIALAGLGASMGAKPQEIQNALGMLTQGVQGRMQREADVQKQQANFAFTRAEQMRDREDKSAAAQAKGAALMLDAAQAKNPQEAQILLAEAQRVMGKAPTAGQALGIMDRAQKSEQAANDIIEFNRSVKEAQMANTKADNERMARDSAVREANAAFAKWVKPLATLATPPTGAELAKLQSDYDAFVAKNDALGGDPLPPFELLVEQRLGQYNAQRGQANWQKNFDRRILEFTKRREWKLADDEVKRKERQQKLEDAKAKAEAKIATGVGKDDPDVKETLRQVNYTIDGKLKNLRKIGNPNAIADKAQRDLALKDYEDISQEARDEYNWAALNYGDDHALVKAMRAKLKGMHIEVSPNVRESSRIAQRYNGLFSVPDIPGVTVPKDPAPDNGAYILPVSGYKLTSKFGPRNIGNGPMGATSRNHGGVDLAVPVGTPVKAARSGEVITVGDADKAGNIVIVRHSDGSTSQYYHLSSSSVKAGDVVTAGQVIAKSGKSGNATGPHLHFEIRDAKGNKLDPRKYLKF